MADLIVSHEKCKKNSKENKTTSIVAMPNSNEAMPAYDLNLKGGKIAVFGFSYKKNTSDTRSTPAATIVARLAQNGF